MNVPARAPSPAVRSQNVPSPLRAPTRPYAQDRSPFPVSISQEELGYEGELHQDQTPGHAQDSERADSSGRGSPSFGLDSPTPSVRSSGAPHVQPQAGRAVQDMLLPPKDRGGASPVARNTPSPLGPLPAWGASNPTIRGDLEQARKDIAGLEGRMTEVTLDHKKTSEQLTSTLQHRHKDAVTQQKIIRELDTVAKVIRSHDHAVSQLLQHASGVEPAHNSIREELKEQNRALREALAEVQERVTQMSSQLRDLIKQTIETAKDHFEALGPLPEGYRRVETLNGPYALHQSSYRSLQRHVQFYESRAQADRRSERLHVDISQQMLCHLAMWKKGLGINQDILGHSALFDLYSFAQVRNLPDLYADTSRELHLAATDAGHKLLSNYPRLPHAEALWETMIAAMAEALPRLRVAPMGEDAQVHVALGRCPHPAARSGALVRDDERAADWRNDIIFAVRALTIYCRVFRVACRPKPQLHIQEATREMTLTLSCHLQG